MATNDYTQFGGKVSGSEFGYSVSLSGNGDALVVGAPSGRIGRVSVYRRDSNVGGMGNYTQVGQDILGKENDDEFGYSVSMSDDGNTFVVGAPFSSPNNIYYAGSVYVYKMDSSVGGMGNYIQVGSDIVGTKIGDSIGFSVSMSGDGNTIVVGAPSSYADAGSVSVYKLDSSVSGIVNYIQVGEDIIGKVSGDRFGSSVSMSGDATSFVVGARGSNENTGYVGVYKQNTTNGNYTQVGLDIVGKEEFDYFGTSVSISGDGDTFVVSAAGRNDFRGGVIVYKMDSSVGGMGNYSQFGPDFYDAARYNFGTSVSISDDGNTFVVGISGGFGNEGSVSVYMLDSSMSGIGNYTRVGPDIVGQALGDYFGFSVSISNDATSFLVGAPEYDENSEDVGYVRLYRNIAPTKAPTPAPTTSPTRAPTTDSPSLSPSSRPVKAPVLVPVTAPVPIPVPVTVPVPLSVPATVPTSAPANAPVPATTPAKVPTTAPANAPVPLSVPAKVPTTAPANAPVPVKTPVKMPTKAPTTKAPSPKATTTSPTTTTPTASPENCGFLGWNLFCPQRGECGFWKRLLNLGNCD